MSNTANSPPELTEQGVAILNAGFVLVPAREERSTTPSASHALMMQAEFMKLGFMMKRELFDQLSALTEPEVEDIYNEALPILATAVLEGKPWQPFYPNFPQQVLQASEETLYLNALVHYWTFGEWRPDYPATRRLQRFEKAKFREIGVGNEADLLSIFTKLLGAKASISQEDGKILVWFVENFGEGLSPYLPDEIPFKEHLALFAATCIRSGFPSLAEAHLKTATDVLRVYANLSKGDVSLASPTRFISLPRPQRRLLITTLERVARPDDLARYPEPWKRAFHSLHVGEHQRLAPKVVKLADTVRNGTLRTFASHVEEALDQRDAVKAVRLLGSRPGEFARRLDHLLRSMPDSAGATIAAFLQVAPQISSRLLLQLLAHLRTRTVEVTKRVVFPKGSVAKARLVRETLPPLSTEIVDRLCHGIEQALCDEFAEKPPLGRVWIDPQLKRCPVPLSLRSASPGLISVARGTRLPIGNQSTLRMFIWWVGRDVDLSCTLYTEDLKEAGHISYTQLRIKGIRACHSGDITSAPKGAAEFIDIDIDQAKKAGVRYLVMSALDYTGVTFAKMKECYAGWMMRDHPDHNALYDPKTLQQKIDLRTPSRLALPAAFDLDRREAIWLDLTSKNRSAMPNNVESNAATLTDILSSALHLENKPTLSQLFELHARARGELVEQKEEAETVFSMNEGLTPFHTSEILSQFL